MEVISFRCTGCQQTLKVKAEYAGRKTKCKKCGTSLTVPEADSAAETAAAPKKAAVADEEEGGGAYGFADELETKPVVEAPKKRKDQPKIIRKVKKKSVQFAEQWEKFRITLMLAGIGMGCWGLMWILRIVVFLLGLFSQISYSSLIDLARLDPSRGI